MSEPTDDIPHPLQPSSALVTEPAREAHDFKDTSSSPATRRAAAKARKYRTRRNYGVTRNQKRKRPNAQKHGVFSVSPIIPGEDPQEFEELHSALFDEWKPSSVTQEEAVFTLADLMWRKLRAQKFVRTKLEIDTWDPSKVAFDENSGLSDFAARMIAEPETAFEKYASKRLRPDKIKHLKQKFPRSKYQSTSEWAEAVINEIETVLLPATPSLEPPQPGEKVDLLNEVFRKIAAKFQMFSVMIESMPLFERDLDLRGRLDGMIHRQVKYLFQLKAMQQMPQ
jgi:hypothetical protein